MKATRPQKVTRLQMDEYTMTTFGVSYDDITVNDISCYLEVFNNLFKDKICTSLYDELISMGYSDIFIRNGISEIVNSGGDMYSDFPIKVSSFLLPLRCYKSPHFRQLYYKVKSLGTVREVKQLNEYDLYPYFNYFMGNKLRNMKIERIKAKI